MYFLNMTKNINIIDDHYKPSLQEEYMCPQHLEYFKRKLIYWRSELEKESLQTLMQLKEENWNEPDLNDRATVELDIILELKSKDRVRKLIEKIEMALIRIEKGQYGYCEDTGEPIGLKRLEARPIATLSIEAQEKHERFERSHNDEL